MRSTLAKAGVVSALVGGGAAVALAVAVGACVGDDPDRVAIVPDAAVGVDGSPSDVSDGGAVGQDSGDAGSPRPCDPKGAFGPPEEVGGLNVPGGANDANATFTADERIVYFHSDRSATLRVYTARRNRRDEAFTNVSLVSFGGDAGVVHSPSVTGDGMHMYVSRNKDGTAEHDLAYSKRVGVEWQPVVDVSGDVNTYTPGSGVQHEADPFPSSDGSSLYFMAETAGNQFQIHHAACAVPGQCTGRKVLPELTIQRGYWSTRPVVSHDELTIFFAAPPEGDGFKNDIWVAERARKGDPFGVPSKIFGSAGIDEQPTWLSADGCRLYFSSNQNGAGYDNFVTERAK